MSDARLAEAWAARHLRTIAEGAAARYGAWMDPEEMGFVRALDVLPVDAVALWARLVERVGPWFRVRDLRYDEIEASASAAAALVAAGFAAEASAADGVGPWVETATVTELRAFARGSYRAAVVAALPPDAPLAATFGPVIRLERVEVFRRLCLWYFGNAWDGLRTLTLAGVGVVRFAPVTVGEGRLFRSREDFERARWLVAVESGEVPAAEAASTLLTLGVPENPAWRRRFERVVASVGGALERPSPELAARVWSLGSRPPARERLVRLAAGARRYEHALALMGEMVASPHDESEVAFVQQFRPRMQRRVGLRPTVIPSPTVPEVALRVSEVTAPEAAALAALASAGWVGVHAENLPWRLLFLLVAWEAIWAPVPGAFHHPYQLGPEDLFEPGFYAERAHWFATAAAHVRAAGPLAVVADRLPRARGVANRLAAWTPDDEPWFLRFVASLSAEQVVAVVERMARDVHAHLAGFPDLVLWEGEALRLREVKSPNDRVQPHQARWMAFLAGLGLDVAVLRLVVD